MTDIDLSRLDKSRLYFFFLLAFDGTPTTNDDDDHEIHWPWRCIFISHFHAAWVFLLHTYGC